MPMSPYSSPNGLLFNLKYLSGYINMSAVPSISRGGGVVLRARSAKPVGGVDSNGWGCAGVWESILAQEIYFFKTYPKPYAQSGSWVFKGLGTWAPRSIWEYDLVTVFTIRPLIQPLTWEMGSSIFMAMSQLKVGSTTWASLSIIPSTESTNREKFLLVMEVLPMLVLLHFSHLGKSVSIPSVL